MDVSELENRDDDIPQAADVCRPSVSKRKLLACVGAPPNARSELTCLASVMITDARKR